MNCANTALTNSLPNILIGLMKPGGFSRKAEIERDFAFSQSAKFRRTGEWAVTRPCCWFCLSEPTWGKEHESHSTGNPACARCAEWGSPFGVKATSHQRVRPPSPFRAMLSKTLRPILVFEGSAQRTYTDTCHTRMWFAVHYSGVQIY